MRAAEQGGGVEAKGVGQQQAGFGARVLDAGGAELSAIEITEAIVRAGVGTDNINSAAATRAGVVVMNRHRPGATS